MGRSVTIVSSAEHLLRHSSGDITWNSSPLPSTATVDLGATGSRFRSIYLSGSIGDGTDTFLASELMDLKSANYRTAARDSAVQNGDVLCWNATAGLWLATAGGGGGGVTAHGDLTGLTGTDHHTQYVLLAGRSGGQTIIGSTAASENLTLQSTSHATRGYVFFVDTLAPSTDKTVDIGDATHFIRNLYIDGSLKYSTESFTASELMDLRSANYRTAARDSAVQNGDVLTYNSAGGVWLAAAPAAVITSHDGLSGLSDDDHSIYCLLAGRSGGQTIIGGTAAGDDLTLTSTSNGTKGNVFFTCVLAPSADKTVDIGDSTHQVKDLYIYGKLIGACVDSYTTAGRPAANAATVGRLIFDTDLNDMLIDIGGTWLSMSSDKWVYADATTWNGSATTVTYTVNGTVEPTRGRVSDARYCHWEFRDASDSYRRIFADISLSATQVTVTVETPLAAGTYVLIGMG